MSERLRNGDTSQSAIAGLLYVLLYFFRFETKSASAALPFMQRFLVETLPLQANFLTLTEYLQFSISLRVHVPLSTVPSQFDDQLRLKKVYFVILLWDCN